ncbi:hypothetical protein MTO96_029120 [Rhipicephalus appendiculatus]
MDTERRVLCKKSLPEGSTVEGQTRRWSSCLLISLVIVCLGVLCSVLVFAYLVFSGSSEQDIAAIDAIPPLNVPKTSATRVTRSTDGPSRARQKYLTMGATHTAACRSDPWLGQ